MAERYTRVYSLEPNLYTKDSPVIISAGALLKDNDNGNILAQLKIKNISDKVIKVVKVRIQEMDSINKVIGEPILYEYLDLAVSRDEEFGHKVAIPMPDESTRAFSVAVVEVDYEDNTSWTDNESIWESLPEQESIPDEEDLKQYRIRYGKESNYKVLVYKDLWLCACGAINHQGEEKCHNCDNNRDELSSCNWETLREEKEERLAKEQAQREAERLAKEEYEKKTKKWAIRGSIIGAIAIVVVIIAMLIVHAAQPSINYNKANRLLNAGDFTGAKAIYRELGDYKDCDEKINECIYQQALSHLKQKEDEEAYELLSSIPKYKDVAAYLEDFVMLPKKIVTEITYSPSDGVCRINEFEFSYDDSGKMISAVMDFPAVTTSSIDPHVYTFDDNGYLYASDASFGSYPYNYNYNPDGSVTKTSENGEATKIYNQFGHIQSSSYKGEVTIYSHNQYDEHHNSTKNSTNTYDISGKYLAHVDNEFSYSANYRTVRRSTHSDFYYIPKYSPNQDIDCDLIWKNVRIIAGDRVWYL